MSRADIYRQPPIEVKWVRHGQEKFTAIYNGYNLIVRAGGWCWTWEIFKDGTLVNGSYYHPCSPNSELDAKIKCQRALNKLK